MADHKSGRGVFRVMSAWENRYEHPTADELLAPLSTSNRKLVAGARDELAAMEDHAEHIAWQGVPWRWTFTYAPRIQPSARGRALAYLVPHPENPFIAVPFCAAFLDSLPPRRITRPVRDGLIHAPLVGETRWAQWTLASDTLLKDVVRLIAASREPAASAT